MKLETEVQSNESQGKVASRNPAQKHNPDKNFQIIY